MPASTAADVKSLPAARPLFAKDLAELCELDVAAVVQGLESRPKGSHTAVALLPDIDTIRWHHAREEFVGTELHGKIPEVKGAIVGTEKGKRVWCYWTRMWYNSNPAEAKGNTLHILRLVIEDARLEQLTNGHDSNHTNGYANGHANGHSNGHTNGHANGHTNGNSADHSHDAAIAALLAMAQDEAQEWKMEHVEMWSPSATALAAAQRLSPGAEVVNRDTESIASLRWYPEHDGPVADRIDWVSNEKYGWC